MFKTKRNAVMVLTDLLLVICLILLVAFVIPNPIRDQSHIPLFVWLTVTGIFVFISTILHIKSFNLVAKIRNKTFHQQETGILTEFIEKLRFCYSMDDFYENIGTILEEKADCSVLFIDRQKDYVLYNSSDKLTCNPAVLTKLSQNFPLSWAEGCYFLGDNYGIVSGPKTARGFFIVHNSHQLFIFCRYTKLFDPAIYSTFVHEFKLFFCTCQDNR